MKYYVYIVECGDGTFYTGITTHLERRLQLHNQGKGAKYTRGRTPVYLRYVEEGEGRSWASQREQAIKRLSRSQKKAYIAERGVQKIATTEE